MSPVNIRCVKSCADFAKYVFFVFFQGCLPWHAVVCTRTVQDYSSFSCQRNIQMSFNYCYIFSGGKLHSFALVVWDVHFSAQMYSLVILKDKVVVTQKSHPVAYALNPHLLHHLSVFLWQRAFVWSRCGGCSPFICTAVIIRSRTLFYFSCVVHIFVKCFSSLAVSTLSMVLNC